LEEAKTKERLLEALLLLCAVLFAVALASGIYAYWSTAEIRKAKSLVAGPQELMERLMKGRASDECARPHTISDIGFVLNPSLKRCTLWVDEDQAYDVNTMGLRGKEIQTPDPHRKRVLVVGDSWVWGWKQPDSDRLEIQLSTLLNEGLMAATSDPQAARAYEFHTVAMPAWNIISEHAFLESHYARLLPDYVIWVMTQNDVIDIAGVIPPGVIAHSLSTQLHNHAPFKEYSNTLYPMPFIRERWETNIGLVNQFQAKYGVPVLGMFVDMPPGFVSYVTERVQPQFPVFMDPPLKSDKRWNVNPGDSHPSAWATRAMALAFLDAMSQSGFMPTLQWKTEDRHLIDAWSMWQPTEKATIRLGPYTESWVKKTPWEYPRETGVEDEPSRTWIEDKGVLFINVHESDDALALALKVDKNLLTTRRVIHFQISSQRGSAVDFEAVLMTPLSEFQIPLPKGREQPLIEVRWLSDFIVAAAPDNRSIAELVSLKGVRVK
jgi:hypothetical protein